MADQTTLIALDAISLRYPASRAGLRSLFRRSSAAPRYALDKVSFTMRPGERVALVGLNGSGKSTLLRTIAGIYPPQSGTVEVHGQIAALFNLGIGMRMDLSGRRNAILQGLMYGLTPDAIEALLPEIIAFSELGSVIDNPVNTYSQGMAMRLSFAVATAVRPDILLLDEWIGAGDKVFREKAQARLLGMVEDSRGFILASHNTKLLKLHCERAVWLDRGRVVQDGDIETVLEAFDAAASATKQNTQFG